MSQKSTTAFEIGLGLLAAVGASIAAIGGFASAFFDKQRDDLELTTAIHLACRPTYRALEQASKASNADMLFLSADGGRLLHVAEGSMSDDAGHRLLSPEPFARCTLFNYGRLPVLNLRVTFSTEFFDSQTSESGSQPVRAYLDVPGIAPQQSYEFRLANGTPKVLSLHVERTFEMTHVDSGRTGAEALFVDRALEKLEGEKIAAGAFPGAENSQAKADREIRLHHFALAPPISTIVAGERVRFVNDDDEAHNVTADDGSWRTGAIDRGHAAVHRFDHPGTFGIYCAFHNYMIGKVIVRPRS
jgi:plastocyanin